MLIRKKTISQNQLKRIQEIGSFIKNWRLNECQTQSEFLELSDSPPHINTLQHIESGKNITLASLLNLIDSTGLTLSQFFDGME